jgi:hypothetical protein
MFKRGWKDLMDQREMWDLIIAAGYGKWSIEEFERGVRISEFDGLGEWQVGIGIRVWGVDDLVAGFTWDSGGIGAHYD